MNGSFHADEKGIDVRVRLRWSTCNAIIKALIATIVTTIAAHVLPDIARIIQLPHW